MKLVEVVILVGSQCLSPVQSAPGLTEVGKVPCAVLIRQDPRTADVEIVPQAAATDPDVVAMLVKPHTLTPQPGQPTIVPTASEAEDVTASPKPPRPVPDAAGPARVIEASAETVQEEVVLPKARPVAGTAKKAAAAAAPRPKRVASAKRGDACGSYRAVWYTNKDGRRRYRCVKTG